MYPTINQQPDPCSSSSTQGELVFHLTIPCPVEADGSVLMSPSGAGQQGRARSKYAPTLEQQMPPPSHAGRVMSMGLSREFTLSVPFQGCQQVDGREPSLHLHLPAARLDEMV